MTDKVVVVTGGGAHSDRVFGIGEQTCLLLAEEGANVVVVDVDQEMVDRTVDEIEALGGSEALGLEIDITDETEVEALAETCEERFGAVDALINNAGIRIDAGPITEMDADDWDTIFDVNLKGMAYCSKHLIPLMADGGSVVNVSSANAELGRENWSVYDATKAGVLALTRDVACDHAADGVRVNSILPGPTVTDYHLGDADDGEVEEAVEELTTPDPDGPGIQNRHAHPRELAQAILFLASDEASFITGTALNVDGGLTAAGY